MDTREVNHVTIKLRPALEKLIDGDIVKDLDDGEEICPTCGGFSLAIRDNPHFRQLGQYGMKQYKNEQLVLMNCPDCYNGVVRRCKLCGELMKRGWLKHDCDQQKALDLADEAHKVAVAFENAPIAPPEVENTCDLFFSDFYHDGFFSDWDDFFDEWIEEGRDGHGVPRPEYVWITEPHEFAIDARTICERATEDLYDNAYDDISDRDFERLQALLDKWCASCGVGTTHTVSHRFKVRIPWERYDERYAEND